MTSQQNHNKLIWWPIYRTILVSQYEVSQQLDSTISIYLLLLSFCVANLIFKWREWYPFFKLCAKDIDDDNFLQFGGRVHVSTRKEISSF